MFKQILFTQWRWGAGIALFAAIAGFAIPVASVQNLGASFATRWEVASLMSSMQGWGYLYPMLATVAGLTMAITAWANDHQGRHVYALSLPVPRWHYVLLRFTAGAILLAPAVIGVWVGGLVAAVSITLPTGLHAYPAAIALRFALAALLMYAFIFAVGSGTKRTATWVFGSWLGILLVHVLLKAVTTRFDLLDWIFSGLGNWPGPLELFAAAWMLINV